MIENSKRADKMWETGNSNIDSYETLENSTSVIKLVEVNHEERKDAELRNISDSLNPDFKSKIPWRPEGFPVLINR